MKKNVKVDTYCWIAENGALHLGFYFGDSDEPVTFETTLKQVVRETLNSYTLNSGEMAEFHIEDAERLDNYIIAAANLVKQEIKRVKEHND